MNVEFKFVIYVLALGKFQLYFMARSLIDVTASIDGIVAVYRLTPMASITKSTITPIKLAYISLTKQAVVHLQIHHAVSRHQLQLKPLQRPL